MCVYGKKKKNELSSSDLKQNTLDSFRFMEISIKRTRFLLRLFQLSDLILKIRKTHLNNKTNVVVSQLSSEMSAFEKKKKCLRDMAKLNAETGHQRRVLLVITFSMTSLLATTIGLHRRVFFFFYVGNSPCG